MNVQFDDAFYLLLLLGSVSLLARWCIVNNHQEMETRWGMYQSTPSQMHSDWDESLKVFLKGVYCFCLFCFFLFLFDFVLFPAWDWLNGLRAFNGGVVSRLSHLGSVINKQSLIDTLVHILRSSRPFFCQKLIFWVLSFQTIIIHWEMMRTSRSDERHRWCWNN